MQATDALSLAVELGAVLEAAGLPYATWFLSPELLSCFKLLFFRPKDLLDLERLVSTSTSLNASRVRELIVGVMGEDDERVRAWDDIVTRFRPASS